MRRYVPRARLALLAPILLLAGVELALRALGLGWPAAFFLESESDGRAVWRDNPEFGLVCFTPGQARAPAPFVLNREPAPYRVVVLGESAALGDPDSAYGLARMLQAMLEPLHTGRVESVSAAMTAINSHVMRRIAHELPRLRPDAVVIYAGHNEVVGPFGPAARQRPASRHPPLAMALRATRTGQLASGWITGRGSRRGWTGMQQFLDRQVRDGDPRLARVYADWEANLGATVQAAREAGARVVLCTVGVNLRLPPFASLNRPGLTPEQQATWVREFGSGTREGLRRALALDDGHAHAQYRLGLLLEQAGLADEGAAHLARARDLDTLRFRADHAIQDTIRRVARRADAQVDGEALLADPGDYYDHVHLTFEGTWKLAAAVLGALHPAAAPLDPVSCRARLAFTDWDRHRLQVVMRERMRRPPFSLSSPPIPTVTGLAASARATYDDARAAWPDDAELALARARWAAETGDVASAWDDLARVLARHPRSPEARALRGRLAVRRGDFALAEQDFLEASGLGRRSRAQAWLDIGTELAALNRIAEARDWFARAAAADPRHAFAHYNLGVALAALGDDDGATRAYEAALRQDPQLAQAHNNLGAVCLRRGEWDQAARHFEEALRLDPAHPTARRNLADARERRASTR